MLWNETFRYAHQRRRDEGNMTTNNEQPTTTWYRVANSVFAGHIDDVQVIKETEDWLTLNDGSRVKKSQDSSRYFPSLEEAQKYAEELLTQRIESAESSLIDARTTLANL